MTTNSAAAAFPKGTYAWNTGHIRAFPWSPVDWVRTVFMQFTTRWRGVSVEELCAQADVGDVVLMSGVGTAAFLQEVGTNSPWSHVGVVVRMAGKMCILHATPHAGRVRNLLPGKGAVCIQPLRDFVESYLDGAGLDVALRRLGGIDDGVLDADGLSPRERMNNAFLQVAQENANRRFEPSVVSFVTVRYPVLGGAIAALAKLLERAGVGLPVRIIHAKQHYIHCTRLFVLLYVAAGLFRADAVDTQFVVAPGDLGSTLIHTVVDLAAGDGHLPWAPGTDLFLHPELYVN